MLQEAHAHAAAAEMQHGENMRAVVDQPVSYARLAGISLIAGAIVATLFNVLFPRGDDPTDAADMLTMMAENQAIRQASFLGVTAGLWLLTVGLTGICWQLSKGPGQVLARFGFYGLIVGAGLFTVSTGIGMAATGAAVDWAAAGSEMGGTEFAVASALNIADDGVWAMSIIVFWAAVGLIGLGMERSGTFPRWLSVPAVVLGSATAFLVGVPIAYAGVSTTMIIVFAILAQLTIFWAVATGIWLIRTAR